MAIQRGIALSAFSDTTAGLTLSQARLSSWIAAAERVRVRVWTQLHSRGRATPWSVGEGVCALWAGRPGAGVELMASMDLRNASPHINKLAARQMSNGSGDGDLHYTTPARELGSWMARRAHDQRTRVTCVCPGPFRLVELARKGKRFCCNQTFPGV